MNALGQNLLFQETGQFNEWGYISYHGELSFEELLSDNPEPVAFQMT